MPTRKKLRKTLTSKPPEDAELIKLSAQLESLADSYELDDPESAAMPLQNNQEAVPQTFSYFVNDISPEYIQAIMEKQSPHSDFPGLPRGLLSRVAFLLRLIYPISTYV